LLRLDFADKAPRIGHRNPECPRVSDIFDRERSLCGASREQLVEPRV
jgi:hypothetical protein